MRASDDFRSTMRQGSKSGRRTVVVYVAQTGNADRMAGFAVSRAVGGAVTRNLVKRRLRSIVAPLLESLPSGAAVVVRALPAAAAASYAQLAADVEGALVSAARKVAA